jgi:hypothetical protein
MEVNVKYRIYNSHCGRFYSYETFNRVSDDEALAELIRRRNHPYNAWDNIWMERIDVEEKTTRLDVKS